MKGKPDFSWLKDWRVRALAVGCLIVGFLVAALIFGKPWHLAPNWADIPIWLGVVAAAASCLIALSQLRSQTEDRRKAQAERVYIGVPSERGPRVYPYVKNASDFPIYEAKFWYLGEEGQLLPGEGIHKYLGTIAPGDERRSTQDFPSDVALRSTVLTFRDANDVWWIRMPGGVLKELPARPDAESVGAIVQTLPQGLGPMGRERYGRGSGDAQGSANGLGGGG